jgi:hypothetical protein
LFTGVVDLELLGSFVEELLSLLVSLSFKGVGALVVGRLEVGVLPSPPLSKATELLVLDIGTLSVPLPIFDFSFSLAFPSFGVAVPLVVTAVRATSIEPEPAPEELLLLDAEVAAAAAAAAASAGDTAGGGGEPSNTKSIFTDRLTSLSISPFSSTLTRASKFRTMVEVSNIRKAAKPGGSLDAKPCRNRQSAERAAAKALASTLLLPIFKFAALLDEEDAAEEEEGLAAVLELWFGSFEDAEEDEDVEEAARSLGADAD